MRDLQLKFLVNKTNIRWLQILNTLERNRFCTAEHLASITGSSSRTIRKDISNMKVFFDSEIKLTTSRMGYHFTVSSLQTFLQKKKNLIDGEVLLGVVESIFRSKLYSVDEWAEMNYVSKSTLIRYIQKVQDIFIRYDITLSLNPLNLIGLEKNIRKFFHDFYYESDITPHSIFPPYVIQEMTETVFSAHDLKELYSPADFYYNLYIAVERSSKGNPILISSEKVDFFDQKPEFSNFCLFNELIHEVYGYSLTKEELVYLYLTVINKQSTENAQADFYTKYSYWPEIEILANIYAEAHEEEPQNTKEVTQLTKNFFTSIKLNDFFSPILNQNLEEINRYVQETYGAEYEKTCKFLEKYFDEKFLYAKYKIDICASFTLYRESIKETSCRSRRKIALIFEGNQYICQSIKAKTMKYFGENHELFFPTINEFNLEYLKKKKIDLIVTNFNEHLLMDNLKTDSILFKAIPDSSDWNYLTKKLNKKASNTEVLE